MRIISSFRDYYDWISNRFGGGDPMVVYDRNRLTQESDPRYPYHVKLRIDQNSLTDTTGFTIRWYKDQYLLQSQYSKVVWVVVAGVGFLAEEHTTAYRVTYTLLNETDHKKLLCGICGTKHFSEALTGIYSRAFVEMARELNAPVFVVTEIMRDYSFGKSDTVLVSRDIPILGNIGFPSIIPPEQMYQNIAYFLGNTIKTNPDIAPPVEIGNTSKIIAHGFDIKKSFRHRK